MILYTILTTETPLCSGTVNMECTYWASTDAIGNSK
uniref:Uncharacterized protein n=1 Tax=Arundo donax TaxID=35708 RepID=A0A0A9BH08_ARUDO